MKKEIIASGKDIAAAVENAKIALGAETLDEISYEIIDMGSKGIFGVIGVKPVKIRAYIAGAEDVAVEETAEKSERGEQRSRNRNRNRNRNRSRNRSRGGDNRRSSSISDAELSELAAKNPSTGPKEAVIPEAELKMEKVDAAEGEDLAYDFIKRLIADLGLNATAELFTCEDNTRRIVIAGEDAGILIGHHGETLDSLQYLANLSSAQKNANGERNRRRVTIDIEGYRAKREETLRSLARRMAAKALKNQRNVSLEPMSAYERRIIHSEIQGIDGVTTMSIGSDNNRKIVICLQKDAPAAEIEATEEDAL